MSILNMSRGSNGLRPAADFLFFLESRHDGGQKDIPFDDAVQSGEWIAFFVAPSEDDLLVEESWL